MSESGNRSKSHQKSSSGYKSRRNDFYLSPQRNNKSEHRDRKTKDRPNSKRSHCRSKSCDRSCSDFDNSTRNNYGVKRSHQKSSRDASKYESKRKKSRDRVSDDFHRSSRSNSKERYDRKDKCLREPQGSKKMRSTSRSSDFNKSRTNSSYHESRRTEYEEAVLDSKKFEELVSRRVDEVLKKRLLEIESAIVKRIQEGTIDCHSLGTKDITNAVNCKTSLSGDAEIIKVPFNAESLHQSNLGAMIDFLFSIDKDVISKISAWTIIKNFDRLFNEDQSNIICITRPPCWGKTTIINILMLYYSINFPLEKFTEFQNEKLPNEVLFGKRAIQLRSKSVSFSLENYQKLEYDDRSSKLCFLLDFSTIQGKSVTELQNDLKFCVHRTLQNFIHCLPNNAQLKKCARNECDEINHLKILVETLELLSELNEFKEFPKVLFIDELDFPLIRLQDPEETRQMRRSLETLVRQVSKLRFTVIAFGIFPNICDDILPNDMAKACSVAHSCLKTAFGINTEIENNLTESAVNTLRESANGFTYAGTNNYSLYCYTLWKENKKVYPKTYLKYKSFLLIENKFKEDEYFVDLTSNLLKYKMKFVADNDDSSLRSNLNILFYAGFLVTRKKSELTKEMTSNVLLCLNIENENDIPDDGMFYVFPNEVMQNSIRLFLCSVLRSNLVAKFGQKYLSEVEIEFVDAKLQSIVDRICSLFQCSKIEREKDYEKQLSNNLAPILLESYFVINQVPSGRGILDVILLPKSKDYPLYVIEAKWKVAGKKEELDNSCLIALHQIWTLKYHDKFISKSTQSNIYFIGIAVSSTSISCSIAEKEEFQLCICRGENKDKLCEIVKTVPRKD